MTHSYAWCWLIGTIVCAVVSGISGLLGAAYGWREGFNAGFETAITANEKKEGEY
jgi:hypothetical protein